MSDDMKRSMTTNMDSMQKMQMSGDSDEDFAMMMKMHHQQGVEMAQMERAHGKSPVIAQFEQWLARQK